jgi:hypothetical protein
VYLSHRRAVPYAKAMKRSLSGTSSSDARPFAVARPSASMMEGLDEEAHMIAQRGRLAHLRMRVQSLPFVFAYMAPFHLPPRLVLSMPDVSTEFFFEVGPYDVLRMYLVRPSMDDGAFLPDPEPVAEYRTTEEAAQGAADQIRAYRYGMGR